MNDGDDYVEVDNGPVLSLHVFNVLFNVLLLFKYLTIYS